VAVVKKNIKEWREGGDWVWDWVVERDSMSKGTEGGSMCMPVRGWKSERVIPCDWTIIKYACHNAWKKESCFFDGKYLGDIVVGDIGDIGQP